MIHRMRPAGPYTDGLCSLIAVIQSNLAFGEFQMAEVGVHMGEATRMFLDALVPNKFYAIDIWQGGYDPNDTLSNQYTENYEALFDEAIQDAVVKKFKMSSLKAATHLENRSLDFVYIDACHTYEAVKHDILAFLPKIKPGGWIGGHDYSDPNFPGVKQAVDEEFGKPQQIFADGSWLVKL